MENKEIVNDEVILGPTMSADPFARVIGYEEIKKQLARTLEVLRGINEYKAAGAKIPAGLLLSGEPGVGKTLMATCLIEAAGLPCFTVRRDKATDAFADALKQAFDDAVASAPAIVYLDDMDKFANTDDKLVDAPEYVAVQACIDEVKGKDVFVLATVNELKKLPRSLVRLGRFDKHIRVSVPDGEDALAIIRHYLATKPLADDISFDDVAMLMWHSSCAKLESIINEATLVSLAKREDAISRDSFMEAFFMLSLGHAESDDDDEFGSMPRSLRKHMGLPLEDKQVDPAETKTSKAERHSIAVHEAGHAAVFEIMRRGTASLVTAFRSRDDRGGLCIPYKPESMNRDEWDRLNILGGLGGRAASDLVFGVCDTGAADDLKKVREMIQTRIDSAGVCGLALVPDREWRGQEFQKKVDIVTAAELERLYQRTKQILAANRGFLDALTAEVETRPYLLASDIAAIRRDCVVREFEL